MIPRAVNKYLMPKLITFPFENNISDNHLSLSPLRCASDRPEHTQELLWCPSCLHVARLHPRQNPQQHTDRSTVRFCIGRCTTRNWVSWCFRSLIRTAPAQSSASKSGSTFQIACYCCWQTPGSPARRLQCSAQTSPSGSKLHSVKTVKIKLYCS